VSCEKEKMNSEFRIQKREEMEHECHGAAFGRNQNNLTTKETKTGKNKEY